MPMLLALALAAQNVPLNPAATEALGCATSIAAVSPKDGPEALPGAFQYIYFVLRAADADIGKGSYTDRLAEMTQMVGPGFSSRKPATQAQIDTVARCGQRFPEAGYTGNATLPVKAFDRDMMCASMLTLVGGAFETTGLKIEGVDVDAIANDYVGRIASAPQFRGLNGDQAADLLGDSLRASLRVGTVEAVVRACIAAAPK